MVTFELARAHDNAPVHPHMHAFVLIHALQPCQTNTCPPWQPQAMSPDGRLLLLIDEDGRCLVVSTESQVALTRTLAALLRHRVASCVISSPYPLYARV